MNEFRTIYKALAGIAVGYTVFRMLEEKTNELLEEGGALNAYVIGSGKMGISMTAGYIAAKVLG